MRYSPFVYELRKLIWLQIKLVRDGLGLWVIRGITRFIISYTLCSFEKPSEIDLGRVSKKVGGKRSLLVRLGVPVNKIKPLSMEYRNPVDVSSSG